MKKLVVATAMVVMMAVLAAGAAWGQDAPEEKVILNNWTFWRQYYVLKGPVVRKEEGLEKVKLMSGDKEVAQWLGMDTAPPPKGWEQADFEDVGWNRKPLSDPDSPWLGLLCLRGRFRVEDPERVKGLKLQLKYRGGVVVYLNGNEIARGHVRKKAGYDGLAEDYPEDDFSQERDLKDVTIAGSALRKGVNVLAVEVHRSAIAASTLKLLKRVTAFDGGAACGVTQVELKTRADDAVVPNVTRPTGFHVWNSSLMNTDFVADWGDPNESAKAIRIVTTRGGVGSGKVVVGSKSSIKGLVGTVGDLVQRGGNGRIHSSSVQVRYAVLTTYGVRGDYGIRRGGTYRYDALEEVAPAEVKVEDSRIGAPSVRRALFGAVQPVWVTVRVPAKTPAGEYEGKLTIRAEGEAEVVVPVEVKVCRWEMPKPSEWVTFVDMMQSPESVAMAYEVPLWSDEHFRQMERSLSILGEVGNKVCHVPLICDTNMGNDESMVRWIRQPDGSYRHDYSIMERYLDAVEKCQGKPTVVCFFLWDAYLEGGLSTGRHAGGSITNNVREERRVSVKKGPIVSVLDEATGKVEKVALPMYSEEKSAALWGPVIQELRTRMAKRQLEKAMMLGYATDQLPAREVAALFGKIAPGVKWVRSAHDRFREEIAGLPMGYTSEPYVWARRLFSEDPSVSRSHGWALKVLEAHFPRNMYDNFPMTQWRFMGEMNAAGELRGFARLGGDFFGVLKDRRGRRVGRLSGRFPKSWWRMLNIQTTLLSAGNNDPGTTARFEVIREGLEETEARIFIDKALMDQEKRAKLGEKLAGRCQTILDERVRNMRRAVSTLCIYESGGRRKWYGAAFSDAWYFHPAVLGNFWYTSSDWQSETEKLYEAAAEVERRLKRKSK